MKLQNQVALVTGASRGIGESIARRLASEGAAVALMARTESALQSVAESIQNEGGRALICPVDVSDQAGVDEAVNQTLNAYGTIDILVNNASIAYAHPIASSDVEEWWRIHEVNVKGLYLVTRAVLPPMLKKGKGQIVNVLSVAARRAFPGASAYCSAKASAWMFSRTLAAEVRSRGIRVTSLLPGSVDTDIWDAFPGAPSRDDMMKSESIAEATLFALTMPEDAAVDEIMVMPKLGVL